VHRSAITPEPPHGATIPDANILNSNQTAEATAEIIQVRLFHSPPPPFDFLILEQIETDPPLDFEN
jgi:hypothetical protein